MHRYAIATTMMPTDRPIDTPATTPPAAMGGSSDDGHAEDADVAAVTRLLRRIDALADLPDADLVIVARHVDRRHLTRGSVLVEQGTEADAVYIIVRGRLMVVVDGRVISELDPGDSVGEIGFFSGRPRSASVIAARDSEVLGLTRQTYDDLARRVPMVPQSILRSLAARLGDATPSIPKLRPKPPRIVTLCPAGDSTIPPALLVPLREALQGMTSAAMVTPDWLPEGLDLADPRRFADWVQELECRFDRLIFVAHGRDAAWDDLVLRQSDGLMLTAPLADRDRRSAAPNRLELRAAELFLPSNRSMIVWRERADMPIRGTARWLERREIHLHHHLALDRPADVARVARMIDGRTLGLVLAGGGALGCAHLGVAKALQERGVVVDMFGGTSVGSAMAIGLAQGYDPRDGIARFEDAFIAARAMGRLTLPIYSIFDHSHYDEQLQRLFGWTDLADLPVAAFAVAASLTTDDLVVLRSGPAWAAVRASSSIPAALPPFITDEGDVLVDGAVLDNVPLETMRALRPGPNIVVTLQSRENWRLRRPYMALPARMQLVRRLLRRREAEDDYPRIMGVVARALMTTSRRRTADLPIGTDVLLTPPTVEGMGILDWSLGRRQMDGAYDYTARLLDEAGGVEGLFEAAAAHLPGG